MGVTRREFLKGCAAGAAAATLPATGILERAQAAGTPDPVYRPFMEVALDTARQLGATYADMRVAATIGSRSACGPKANCARVGFGTFLGSRNRKVSASAFVCWPTGPGASLPAPGWIKRKWRA